MQFKLLLKQSFRDFLNKIALYLTFTLFLILTISVSLGMISFSYGFSNVFTQTLGYDRINAKLGSVGFLPSFYNDSENSPDSEIYVAKEKIDEQTQQGYIAEFLAKIMPEMDINSDDFKKMIFGLGYKQGSVFDDLTRKDLLQDKTLSEQITTQTELDTYNQNALTLRQRLNNTYQTKNLLAAYFIQHLWDNSEQYRLGGPRPMHKKELEIEGQNDPLIEFKWQYLKTDSTMGNVDQETPATLKITSTNTQKIWKSVNWEDSQYQTYYQNYHFVYVPMTFLHHFHYRVGETINLRFKTWDYKSHEMQPETFLIAGTISTPDLIAKSNDKTLVFPYPLIRQVWNSNNQKNGIVDQKELDAEIPAVFWDEIYFNVLAYNKDVNGGQKDASDWFNTLFSNRQNPGEFLETSVQWSKWDAAYAYEFTQVLFLIISYLIGFLTLGLLFVVFYFITQQIVVLQRKTLFFLKAMGVKNSGLSLLTTFAMIPPLLIGLIAGFFGSLLIQQMMYGIAFDTISFYIGYWSFNIVYFIALFGIILAAFIIFYLINILLIRSKSLTIEGMNAVKNNARFFEFIKTKFLKTSPKFRIGVSFAFKNIYKNLIAYFILSLTFGIILFGTQFNSSLTVSAHAYEKWNQPYKSVLYANNLKVFAPTREPEEDKYIPAYEQVSDFEGMIAIRNDDDLSNAILAYRESLSNPDLNFNWKKYYFAQEYVRDNLDLITDNKNEYNKLLQKISDLIKEYFPDSSDAVILSVTDLIDTIIEKYRDLRDEYNYHDGFNLLFGQVYLPRNNRSILSLATNAYDENSDTTDILAFAPNDLSTQDHFHLSKFATSKDFLVDGSYQEFDPVTNKKVTKYGKLLEVNVSTYLASIENLHRNDTLTLEISGLKSAKSARSSTIYAHINQIVKEDTIRSTVYTSQAGLMEYMVEATKRQISDSDPSNPDLKVQLTAYENLLTQINAPVGDFNLNNTVFDLTNQIPLGLRYLTLPIFHHTKKTSETGTRIEDFYDEAELPRFLKILGKDILVFNLVTQKLLSNAIPFNEMMQRFIIILVVVSLIVSSILITLVLLENREVILLFKAMGYKKSEVNWYLISGYFISTILATITAVALAIVMLNAARGVIAEYLSTALYFVWSWQFIVFALGLATAFCLAISVSIVVYTNWQKPRDAFATL